MAVTAVSVRFRREFAGTYPDPSTGSRHSSHSTSSARIKWMAPNARRAGGTTTESYLSHLAYLAPNHCFHRHGAGGERRTLVCCSFSCQSRVHRRRVGGAPKNGCSWRAAADGNLLAMPADADVQYEVVLLVSMKWPDFGDPHEGYAAYGHYPRRTTPLSWHHPFRWRWVSAIFARGGRRREL